MEFKVEVAKNGENSLLFNGKYIYSKYNPSKDAEKFIENEVDFDAKGYLLVGLGLGYHLESLLNLAPNKNILLLLLDIEEMNIFKKHSRDKQIICQKNVKLIKAGDKIQDYLDYQVILPNVWLKAISENHPYFTILEDIKIRQMSYNSTAQLLKSNFLSNIQNRNLYVNGLKNTFENKSACLVSGGPSLNETVKWLQKAKNKTFILSVGSSLKTLLMHDVVPDAIIITDPSINVVKQIEDSRYKGLLFYLSTANNEMSQIHDGPKILLFQQGYFLAEQYVLKIESPLMETGGSVATTAISLIEYLGFKKLFLFGQDLGFKGKRTHSNTSTSGIEIAESFNFRKILSNNGEMINTTPNLSTYHRWIERKARKSKMKIFNTAKDGAKIENVPMIKQDIFVEYLQSLSDCQFKQVLENKLKN